MLKIRFHRRSQIAMWIGLVISAFIVLILVILGSYFGYNYKDLGANDEELGVANNNKGVQNILLLGVDSRTNSFENTRPDAIMILSIDKTQKKFKMTSILRDTYLYDEARQKFDKINHSYAFGGSVEIIRTLNQSLDMNIREYVIVNFAIVQELVDIVGGVQIDVQENIINELNKYIKETNKILGSTSPLIQKGGMQRLDGVQTIAYTRIRKVDSDEKRAQRQQEVVMALLDKIKASSPTKVLQVANKFAGSVETSISNQEILNLSKDFFSFKKYTTENMSFPKKSSGKLIGGIYYEIPITLSSNVTELHQFIYGTENYVPSATVDNYSKQIINISGLQ